ncbi:MAG TPA: NAD(P)-binding domain-containing protein [Candidatus Limnocylindrales bacterium]|nr:NAD(P)-binding domain-containing protein [Candidatus Limnocylindrales bacterium]
MGASERIETVVVGAGHAGLIASHLLTQAGREHVVLESRPTNGGAWQDRWDEFQLVSPNWTLSFPGLPYDGDDPDGFMARDEIVGRIRRYAEVTRAPLRLGTEVLRLAQADNGAGRFRLELRGRPPILADRVIVATGPFQAPRTHEAAARVDPAVRQLHVDEYRREADLPPGAVLVVGTGQSGAQLTEELLEHGRRVVLSVGRCGRAPRRYRGRDTFGWLHLLATRGSEVGLGLPTAAMLPDLRLRYACNPHVSGHAGGHTVNLRQFGADGVRLVGRFADADGRMVRFAPDLAENLAFADRFFVERFQPDIDKLIDGLGIEAPPHEPEQPVAFEPPPVEEIDLVAEGISTILWTSGYRLAFGRWIELPIFDDHGFPRTERGVSEIDGLGFVGVPWMTDQGSANLIGVARDAQHVVERLS